MTGYKTNEKANNTNYKANNTTCCLIERFLENYTFFHR